MAHLWREPRSRTRRVAPSDPQGVILGLGVMIATMVHKSVLSS